MVRGICKLWGLVLVIALVAMAAFPVQGAMRSSDAQAGGEEYVFVRFGDQPTATYDGSVKGFEATKPGKGQRFNPNSQAANKWGNRLKAQQENYIKWLAKHAPQVEVVADYQVTFNGVALKLNGATLKQIQGGPGAVEANYSATYRPAMNSSHELINDGPLWEALGGQENAGAGIKVAVIDTGIDQAHPFLQPNPGMRAPAGYPRGDTRFTSDKVIVAKVFHQDPWQTAQAVDSHGTHVAGTIAGRAGTDGDLASGLSGVAPGAWLGNYNVFPGTTENAKSVFIAKAVEEAVKDGMDVLNLSLGGTPHKGADLLDMAVDAAVAAGVVVAVAAGNEGPGWYTLGSPGTADGVITVAAVTNSHSFVAQVSGGPFAEPVVAASGDEGGALTATLTGEYDLWSDYAADGGTLACSPLAGTPLAGKIALLQRGVCTFAEKVQHAAQAGAIGVILYQRDDVDGPPTGMSTPGATIPAVMVSRDDGYALRDWTGSRVVTLEPPSEQPADGNRMADFTSWGPTPNYTLKPDLAAVGVDVYSSVVGGGYAAYDGTSMATPHVAGAAALLLAQSRQEGLGWGPAEVKAALMGTARPVEDTEDPLQVGAGLIDLGRAMAPPALAMPSSLSFGLVRPVGNHTYSRAFQLTNSTGEVQTYSLTAPGELSLSRSSLTLEPGESATVTVTVVDRGSHIPGQGGTPQARRGLILIESEAGSIRLPYLYMIDYNR